MGHLAASSYDDPRGFVAQNQREGRSRPVKLMELGVANPRSELLDYHMGRAGLRDIDVVDDHGLFALKVDRCRCLHGAPSIASV
jgi:hypothetical protein